MSPVRKAIPESIRRAVYIEAGYRCAVPTCRALLIVDLHHIVPVAQGGPNTAENLIALCPTCHALFERGLITGDAIRAWKAVLVSLSAAFDRATIDDLLFLREVEKHQGRELVMTGDGIGKYSQLFAARLADYFSMGGQRSSLGNVDYFQVRISKRGERLLEAWESGNEEALRTFTATGTDGAKVGDSATASRTRSATGTDGAKASG